jgi:hypothetical protein
MGYHRSCRSCRWSQRVSHVNNSPINLIDPSGTSRASTEEIFVPLHLSKDDNEAKMTKKLWNSGWAYEGTAERLGPTGWYSAASIHELREMEAALERSSQAMTPEHLLPKALIKRRLDRIREPLEMCIDDA